MVIRQKGRFAATISQVSRTTLACLRDVILGLRVVFFSTGDLSKQYDTSRIHFGHVARQAEAMLKDDSFDAEERCQRENLVVGDTVFPTDAKDSSEIRFL